MGCYNSSPRRGEYYDCVHCVFLTTFPNDIDCTLMHLSFTCYIFLSPSVYPAPQEGNEQSQPVSSSPPVSLKIIVFYVYHALYTLRNLLKFPILVSFMVYIFLLQEAIVTPSNDKPEQLKVEEVDSISTQEETEKDAPKQLGTENELVVEDIGDDPESSLAKKTLPTRDNVVMKVESVHSLEDCAPGALEDSPAPPELDATMVNSPLLIAVSSKEGAELKSASAVMVRDDDKLDLRATHSHADMDKKRGQELDFGNIYQVTSKADEPEVEVSTSENKEAAEVKETSSKSSLEKVDSDPTIENKVESEPTVDTVCTDPPVTNDGDATSPKDIPAEVGSPASEDNSPTEEPVTDKKEASSPTPNNANEGEPIPTAAEDTTPTTNDNLPQSIGEIDSPPV